LVLQRFPLAETRCRHNGTKLYWPAIECYRRQQTPESITSLAPALGVGGPVITFKGNYKSLEITQLEMTQFDILYMTFQ